MIKYMLDIVIGGALGFLYYKTVGCPSGTCSITSNPYISTIYGAILGAILAGVF